jgi:hypothetical protein
MTLVEEAIHRLRGLPPADQESAAETVLAIVEQYEHSYRLTPEQVEQVRRTREGLKDGTVGVASDEEVEAMWRRLGA